MTTVQAVQSIGLREKLLSQGAQALSDSELLAVFISSGSGKKSCLQLGLDLLKHFGNLRNLLQSEPKEFCTVPGLGPVRYAQLQALKEICRRSDFIELQKSTALQNTQDTWSFLKRQLRDRRNEVFVALYLDNQYRVLGYEELFKGTINAAAVHTRPLIESVMRFNAAAVIIAHNHPSGHAEASSEDLALTRRIEEALSLVDAHLVDHLIVGDNRVYSILQAKASICH